MKDAPDATALTAPMTGAELLALRKRSGLERGRYCGAIGITSNQLASLENDRTAIPADLARRARQVDGQGATGKRVGVATFGDRFVVVLLSQFDASHLWRVDVLPVIHATRTSAVAAGRDFATLHGHEFVTIGF